MMAAPPASEGDRKEFEKIMTGYHDLVDSGRREIYKLEGWKCVDQQKNARRGVRGGRRST
jgi:hypothetical protein